MSQGELCATFSRLDGQRQAILELKRSVARLVDPALMPDSNWQRNRSTLDPTMVLPSCYSSMGPRGAANIATRLHLQAFPPMAPWFSHEVHPYLSRMPGINPELIARANQQVWLHDLTLQSMIESAPMDQPGRCAHTFRSATMQACMAAVVVGESCVQCLPSMQVRVHGLPTYVVDRDASGNVYCVVLKERVDLRSLPQEVRDQIPRRDRSEDRESHMVDLYTEEEWDYETENWVITQEIEGKIVRKKDGTPYPEFIVAPFMLHPYANHGTGHFEMIYGDLYSINVFDQQYLEWGSMASRHHPLIDPASGIQPEHFQAPNGTPLVTTTEGGGAKYLGWLKMERGADFGIVQAVRESKRQDVGKSLLLDSEVAGRGEAFRHSSAWAAVAAENNAQLGPAAVGFIEHFLTALIRRMRWQMIQNTKGKKEMAWLKLHEGENAKVFSEAPRLNVGMASLRAQAMKTNLIELGQFLQVVGQVPDIDPRVAVEVWSRATNQDLYGDGLVKSEERKARERQQAVQMNNQMAAGEAASKALADVATATLTPQPV